MEQVIETKICANCQQNFSVTDDDLEFYHKMKVPAPVECAPCREQRRVSFRNEKTLYLRPCSNCKKQIVSVYSADKPYNVFCAKCWWSDIDDPVEIGRDYDFSRSFFEQFDEIMHKSKVLALYGVNNQNSDFVNQETDDKNCYLNAGGHYNEDCYYNTYTIWGKNNVDNYWVIKSELLYECIYCEKCYNSSYLQDCMNCTDCHYCYDCTACENCFGSIGLRHKKYHFFNQPMAHEEYESKIKEYLSSYNSREKAQKETKKHFLKYPHRANYIINCEDCSGDYLKNCKNVNNSFLVENCWDCKNFSIGLDVKDSRDLSSFGWSELCYNCASSGRLNNVMVVSSTFDLDFSSYCVCCSNSSKLFGCVGLNQKSYCILNKQYSEEQYHDLLPRIIQQMTETREYGQYFPINISPFCYNETIAHEYFPLTKEQALSKGYKWKDPDNKEFRPQTYVTPDNINDVSEEIISKILACKDCGKNYKIINPELKFYRNKNIPIPHNCPDCRHRNRLNKINPHKLHERNCQKCYAKINTTYSSDRSEIVYCEKCYLETVR